MSESLYYNKLNGISCKECGVLFPYRINAVYCSVNCRNKNQHRKNLKNSVKICIVCEKEFISGMGNHSTCSTECSKLNRKRLRSTEYKKEHTNFTNKKNHDKEYYQKNKEKILINRGKYYNDVEKEVRKKKVINTICDVCSKEYMKGNGVKRKSIFNVCSDCNGKFKKIMFSNKDAVTWKGGVTPIHNAIRNSEENKIWIKSVLLKDGYKCVKCGSKKKIIAHHIINFSDLYIDLNEILWDVNNGITFCEECHKNFHKIYGRTNNNKEQVEIFLENKNE